MERERERETDYGVIIVASTTVLAFPVVVAPIVLIMPFRERDMLDPRLILSPYTYKANCMYTSFPKKNYIYWACGLGGKTTPYVYRVDIFLPGIYTGQNIKNYTYSVDFRC